MLRVGIFHIVDFLNPMNGFSAAQGSRTAKRRGSRSACRCIGRAVMTMAVFGLILSGGLDVARGEKPLEPFIEALKERGYFDIAFEYLELAENSGGITSELKGRLDYEKAQVLIDGLSQVRSADRIESNLDQAQSLLQNFIKTSEFHPYASTARKTLGFLLLRRAEIAVDRANAEKVKPDEAAEFLKQARGFCNQASQVLADSRESLTQLLKRLDPKAKDATRRELRSRYENEFLRVRLLQGLAVEQSAATHPVDSAEQKKAFKQAIALYEDFAEDYPKELSRYRALLYAARSYQALGNSSQAETILQEIIGQPNVAALRDLKRDSCLLLAKIWLNEKPPKYRRLIDVGQPLLDTLSPNQLRSPLWLELKLTVAEAWHGLHEQLQAKKDGKTAEDRELETLAKNLSLDYVRDVARVPSEFREAAQKLMLDWGVRSSAGKSKQEGPPTSLTEAMQRANTVLADFESDRAALKTLQVSLKQASEADKAQLQTQLDNTRKSIVSAPGNALELMRIGLRLADEETQRSELEGLFFKMAYAYYAEKDFDRCLVVSEHLITLSPNSAAARGAATYGVQSLIQLAAASDASSQFEVQRLRELCERILRTWPSDPVAVKAAAAMIQLALRAGDADAAEKYLSRVPDGTPGKDSLQMNVGLSVWATVRKGEYEMLKAQKAGGLSKEQVAEQRKRFQGLRVRAQNYVASGVQKLQAKQLDASAARSVLALAQLYADSDKMDESIAVLENPIYGPLTLIANKHPLSNLPKFKISAYQTALSAYIGSLGSASDPQAVTNKARQAMSDLKSSLANDPQGKQRLIAIYLKMASSVTKTMAGLESEDERAAFQNGLNAFLDAVQQEAEDTSVLVWVSSTYSGFAEAANEKGDESQARQYSSKAAQGYEKLLKLKQNDPAALSDSEAIEMKRRYAESLGNSGKYNEAIEVYVELLTEKSAVIDVQVQAARTLQSLGKESRDANAYARAMQGYGNYTDPKTKRESKAIWGWGRLAQTVIRYPKYRDRFIEARYNLALCRYEYAKLRNSSEKYMQMAEKDVLLTLRSDPKLGGPQWRTKFDGLLKVIQKELGKSMTGLPAGK